MESAKPPQAAAPALPPHVSIFSPSTIAMMENLLNAKVFTRLSVSASVSKATLAAALSTSSKDKDSTFDCSFCLQHNNVLLVFDTDVENERDLHHEHVRTVCLMLKDHDFGVEYARCVFDASSAQQAGFQFDKMAGGAVMVVDLMAMQDDDTSSEEEDDEEETPVNDSLPKIA